MSKIDRSKLLAPSPTIPPRPGDARALKALDEVKTERIYYVGPARYARGLKDLKNMTAESLALKDFIEEALDDLFKKYSAGNGRYEATDVAELQRRLEQLSR